MPTRLTSRPRMIGRDDAPGAKLEPVMPGLEKRRSPSVLDGVRRSSSFGTTVTVANWSVTIGSTPACGVSGTEDAGGADSSGAAGAGLAAGAERLTIGLGAVTRISGSCVCAPTLSLATNSIRADALSAKDRAKRLLTAQP